MEVVPRLSNRVLLAPLEETLITLKRNAVFSPAFLPTSRVSLLPVPRLGDRRLRQFSRSSSRVSASGWFSGFGPKKELYPDIVKAGDPVLHEPAREVTTEEIGSEKIEKIIDSMIKVMRKAPGVGLAAPQIGVPLKIIVLEDTKEYMSYVSKSDIEAQDRRSFDLMVILNPVLKKKGNKTALFFEGCLSVVRTGPNWLLGPFSPGTGGLPGPVKPHNLFSVQTDQNQWTRRFNHRWNWSVSSVPANQRYMPAGSPSADFSQSSSIFLDFNQQSVLTDIVEWLKGTLRLKLQGWIVRVHLLKLLPLVGKPEYCSMNVITWMAPFMLIRCFREHFGHWKIWDYLYLQDAQS